MHAPKWPVSRGVMRAVSELVPAARNPRTHDAKHVAQIVASIQRRGWTTPVLIDERNNIIAGHGRVLAAEKLGLDEVPCIVAITKPGDLITLGAHRLLCGDSTREEDVARLLAGAVPFLMVTDPPYGVDYEPEWRNDAMQHSSARTGKIANDRRVDWTAAYERFPGAVAYVWYAGLFAGEVARHLQACKLQVRSQIIWRKSHFAISRGHYHWQHESCWYAVREGSSAAWTGDRTQSTVWDIDHKGQDAATVHGTQKPVECMARAIRNHDAEGGAVYDPFLGSGTTLIACEQFKRRCFGMEIDPLYCDVVVQRWEQLTGEKARRTPAAAEALLS